MLTPTNIPLSIAGLDEDDDCYDEEEEDNYVVDNAMLALVCFMKTHCINVFLFSLFIIHNSLVTFYVIVIINAHFALIIMIYFASRSRRIYKERKDIGDQLKNQST